MAAGQNAPQASGSEKSSWLTILVPAAGVGGLVILAAVVAGLTTPPDPTGKNKNSRSGGTTASVDTSKLTDGTSPSADDPGLKDIGGGLKVRDLKEGDGAVCRPDATVVAHYTGWLTNGTVFDSSRKHGEPTKFPLTGVVAGWQQGIPGMRVGGIRKLVIPPELGYGSQAQRGIPANSTLIFEVELVEIK